MPYKSGGKWKWGNIERSDKEELRRTVYGIWKKNGSKGSFSKFWKTGKVDEETVFMKDNQKITLTMEQLKNLIKESINLDNTDNPFDIENVRCDGWVAYYTKDGEPYLPIDVTGFTVFSYQGVVAKSVPVDLSVWDGLSRGRATFFLSKINALDAVNKLQLDTYIMMDIYLDKCVNNRTITQDNKSEIKKSLNGVDVLETFICEVPEGGHRKKVVIIGSDSLDDKAHEWNVDHGMDEDETW